MRLNIAQIKKIAKISAVFILLCCVFAICYVAFVISMTPIAEKMGKIEPNNKVLLNGGSIEEGAIVKKSALKAFLAFADKSKNQPEELLQEWEQEGKVEAYAKSFYEVKDDIDLPRVEDNHCERIYCFQRKLSFRQIPRVFWKGLIGIEDSRFIHHFGIDFRSIARALFRDIIAMRFVEGGSTITQQLVKNMFYTNQRSIIRKINEIIIAVHIESNYPKEQILESYFNEIVWGSLQGVRVKGIGAASIFYFGKGIEFLEPYEATILISLLKGPYFYHPIKKMDRLKSRVKAVFKRLLDLNFFASTDKLEWSEDQWQRWLKQLKVREKERPYYSIWKALKAGNNTEDFYQKFVLHDKVKDLLLSIPDEVRKKHQIESKLIIANWNGEKFENYYELYSNLERSKETAIKKEIHQLGSILKPLVYKLLLDEEITLSTLITTEPIELALKSGKWTPKESHKIKTEEIEIREALQKSYNNPLIRLADQRGFEWLEERLNAYIPEIQKPLAEYPAQLLGAVELPIFRVAEIYQRFIKESCFDNEPIGKEIVREMADPSLTTIRRVTLNQFKEIKFFGKTGTSNNGNHNWFIAFDGKSVYALWVGASGEKAKSSLKLYGSTTAFRIFQNYLRERGKTFPVFDCLEREVEQN